MKAIDVINDALAIVGMIQFGEDSDPAASRLGLRCLNGLLGELSTKTYYNPGQVDATCTTTGQPFVTLGTDTSAPVPVVGDIPYNFTHIQEVHVEQGPVPFIVPMKSLAEYERFPNKATTGIPQACAWDRQYPISKLYFWPSPSGVTVRVIGSPAITLCTTEQDNIDLPPWYWTALVNGTAMRMIPMLPTVPDPNVIALVEKAYHTSLSGIRTELNNMRSMTMPCGYSSRSRSGGYLTWRGRTL